MPTTAHRAAELLVRSESEGLLPDLPEALRPTSFDAAYAIQDAAIGSPEHIGGWKVTVARGGNVSTCAPVTKTNVFRSGDKYTPRRFGTPEIEGEIAVEIGRDLPPRATPYGRDEVAAAVSRTLAAVEILGSRYVNRKTASPLAVLADFQSNAAIIVGSGCLGWAGIEFARAELTATVDGRPVDATDTGASKDEVLDALTWLANHAAARCGGLSKGQVIITGARIKPFVGKPGEHIVVAVKGVGEVALEIAAS